MIGTEATDRSSDPGRHRPRGEDDPHRRFRRHAQVVQGVGPIQFLPERRRRATYGRHDTVDVDVDDERAVLVVEKPAEDADEWAKTNRQSMAEN